MSALTTIVEKHYREFNTKNFDDAAEIFRDDVETIIPGAEPMHDIKAFLGYVEVFETAFPDGRIEADTMIESGDTISVEGHLRGTNTGPMITAAGEMPATGKKIDLRFADIFTVKDGLVAKHHVYFDQADLMNQLGMGTN